MGFFREIASVLGYDEAKAALGYNYTVFGGEAVYAEGIKRILRIDGEEIALALPRGVLYVRGEDLAADEINGASVLVRGKIQAVYTSEAVEKHKAAGKKE